MKIFLTGKNGQLGHRLEKDLKKNHEVIASDRNTFDLLDTQFIKDSIHQIKPDLIINTAAYTDVDQAEKEKDLAYRVNALGPKALSQSAKVLNIPIIHISTDYVFDGTKEGAYVEDDQANPLSVYGITKWQGEEFVRQYSKHFILRTSWVFSSRGHNFLKTIIKLAQEKSIINMVNDQWGSPTSVKTISKAINVIINRLSHDNNIELYGTYHISNKGTVSRYLYASLILDILGSLNVILSFKKTDLYPVSSDQYPIFSNRPKNSSLNSEKFSKFFKVKFQSLEKEIKETIYEIVKTS